ncbi:hypothetical protein I553_5842 [Mycobacterium xenopi 4042]|uniref:Uncharacterized protein n=1 Tax=Mycobacterium xenopi 4042 TaxID=1299334 RepID=X7ZX15_MYCXE|nr:hypothetical protein I553_5842 [Mycobacterium xenopi 4042]
MVTDATIRVAVALATFVIGWGLRGFLWPRWRGDRVADHADRLPDRAGRGPAAHARKHRHLPARGGPLDHRRRCQRHPGDGIPVLLKATSAELGAEGGWSSWR